MKFRRFVDVVFSLLLVLLGCGLIYSYWNAAIFDQIGLYVQDRLLVAGVGGALVAVVLFRVLAASKPRHKKKVYISFKSGDGTMGISPDAVKNYIHRVSAEYSSIEKMSSELSLDKEILNLSLTLKVNTGERVRDLIKRLHNRVRDCICDDLGLEEKLGVITINVQEIVGEPGKLIAADDARFKSKEEKTEVKSEPSPVSVANKVEEKVEEPVTEVAKEPVKQPEKKEPIKAFEGNEVDNFDEIEFPTDELYEVEEEFDCGAPFPDEKINGEQDELPHKEEVAKDVDDAKAVTPPKLSSEGPRANINDEANNAEDSEENVAKSSDDDELKFKSNSQYVFKPKRNKPAEENAKEA